MSTLPPFAARPGLAPKPEQSAAGPRPAAGRRRVVGGLLAGVVIAASAHGIATAASPSGVIRAVGVENEYADVIAQIGGQYVKVSAIESNPNTDPHTFEASPSVAKEIASAQLIVRNGIGYDDWVEKIMSASPNARRNLINVQMLLKLPDSTPNPHLWYDPNTMSQVAKAIVADLSAIEPAHAAVFQANADKFDGALKPWYDAIASFRASYPATPVAATEPVANYMLEAAGCNILTPFSLQAAIMNGTDPSPQDLTTQNGLFSDHKVKVFAYNQQVTDSLTDSFRADAKRAGIPVVGVYETMPVPGYNYQSWMLAEMVALRQAVTDQVSTERLGNSH
jgi:zinc/manganese transport system substrate-binding protein